MTYKFKSILIFTLCLILVSGFGCRGGGTTTSGPIQIKMWGVFDNSSEIQPFIKAYQAKYPGVKIKYEKKMFSEYENILLNGFAEDTGPDIFVMHNSWLPKYKGKITPAPEDMITLNDFDDAFVSVTADDLIANNRIYALPLYVDTLAMYYNYDHYRVTKSGKPSNNWSDFSEDIARLNVVDPDTQILKRSAIALGTENNVDQSVDVLYQLFLQYGVDFYNNDMSRTLFSSANGVKAFNQYLSYADPKSNNYSWNSVRPDDIYEFVNGRVSTIIGYSYLYEQIAAQSRTKGLDFRIASMPQIDPSLPVTYADYWAYTVSRMDEVKDKDKLRHSWNFLKSLVSEESALSYFDMTHRPTARRSLIDAQEKDRNFGVFANQVRFAKSIKNFDRDKYNILFKEAIEKVRTNKDQSTMALGDVADAINKIISAYSTH